MNKVNFSQTTASWPVVVMGMHKSGTTLIADTLHRSGIEMVGADAGGGYDDGNKMERAETRALNMALLGDTGTESLRLIRPLAPSAAKALHLEQAQELLAGMRSRSWGFKDPRTLLTFGFWEQVLETPILVGIVRDPVEVFGHYLRRADRKWINRDPTFLPDALRAWCVYNQHLLDVKRKHPRMLLLNYADFMTTDAGMQRLSTYVGRELVDCRKPAMRRAEAKPSADYHLARLIVRLRDGLSPDRIYAQLMKDVSK
ncbi:MAG: sulfotransferase [Sulfitobacter sp.]|uniref:sulfotransferase n=1 Tax=Sulfitobacter sp. TaxID=1903071 RepID=UPI00405998FB